MVARTCIAAAVLILAGCTTTPEPQEKIVWKERVVEKQVPVPVSREVPESLRPAPEPLNVIWVHPDDENAVVALTEAGAANLRVTIYLLTQQIKAWRLWGLTPEQEED